MLTWPGSLSTTTSGPAKSSKKGKHSGGSDVGAIVGGVVGGVIALGVLLAIFFFIRRRKVHAKKKQAELDGDRTAFRVAEVSEVEGQGPPGELYGTVHTSEMPVIENPTEVGVAQIFELPTVKNPAEMVEGRNGSHERDNGMLNPQS